MTPTPINYCSMNAIPTAPVSALTGQATQGLVASAAALIKVNPVIVRSKILDRTEFGQEHICM
jgi:hypothetical protein